MALRIVKYDYIWYWISGILSVLSIAAIVVFGLNLSMEFTGGTLMTIQSAEQLSIETLKQEINEAEAEVNALITGGLASTTLDADSAIQPPTEVVELGEPVIVPSEQIYNIKLRATDEFTHQTILTHIKEVYPDVQEVKFETIGPSISANIGHRSIIAIILSLVAMVAYIAYAFRKVPKRVQPWKFGIIAVTALAHDILIVTGIFAVLGHMTGLEVDTLFVTAVLTILGYSINNTIVVFDRIRENLRTPHQGQSFAHLAEASIHQTLRRSFNTSATLLIVLIALFFLGDNSIKWFVFALIMGTIIGTYGSIFIVTPLLVRWSDKK